MLGQLFDAIIKKDIPAVGRDHKSQKVIMKKAVADIKVEAFEWDEVSLQEGFFLGPSFIRSSLYRSFSASGHYIIPGSSENTVEVCLWGSFRPGVDIDQDGMKCEVDVREGEVWVTGPAECPAYMVSNSYDLAKEWFSLASSQSTEEN